VMADTCQSSSRADPSLRNEPDHLSTELHRYPLNGYDLLCCVPTPKQNVEAITTTVQTKTIVKAIWFIAKHFLVGLCDKHECLHSLTLPRLD
jgi:hypothetical protein